MNSIDDGLNGAIEAIRKQYKELKHESNLDLFALRDEVLAFINFVKYKDYSYNDLREWSKDILIDVALIIKEAAAPPSK